MAAAFKELRASFERGVTRPIEWREAQLKAMHQGLKDMVDEFAKALQTDLGRPESEAIFELSGVSGEIAFALANIRKWAEPQNVPNAALTPPQTKSVLHYRPKGVVLVISPFNFPILLALNPMIGAIAAGNCCLLKPSEITPNCAAALQKLADKYLDRSTIRAVQGGVSETTDILKLPFDHFMYTGNGRVGRIVMHAAAEHLAECTLELGGKSPVYVHDDANLDVTAKRLVEGKFRNDGQICVAPDYILVTAKVRDSLIEKMRAVLTKFYGPNKDNTARLVNEHHFDRVKRLLEEPHGGKVVEGGLGANANKAQRFIPPTFVVDPSLTSTMMQEEIFGPVLPFITVQGLDQALGIIRKKDNPLAAYVFTENEAVSKRFFEEVQSGGGCVNDIMAHLRNKFLTLGGTGKSGIGCYGGKFSFELFSHKQSLVDSPTANDESRMYPPTHPKMVAMIKANL